MSTPTPDIDILFRNAILPKMWGRRRCFAVGTLPLSSGRLIVCDPLELQYIGSWLEVPPGRYEVLLNIAEIEYDGRFFPELGAVRLNITDAEVVRWEPALDHGKHYSPGIDSATGCLADADIAEALHALEENVALDVWNRFAGEDSDYEMIDLPGGTAFFFSTCDDGGIPVYQGLDSAGALAAVVVLLPRAEFEVGIDYDESFFEKGGS